MSGTVEKAIGVLVKFLYRVTFHQQDTDLQLLDDRPRLRFHAENRTLGGRYTCIASNGIGDPAQAVIELRIRRKYLFFSFFTIHIRI